MDDAVIYLLKFLEHVCELNSLLEPSMPIPSIEITQELVDNFSLIAPETLKDKLVNGLTSQFSNLQIIMATMSCCLYYFVHFHSQLGSSEVDLPLFKKFMKMAQPMTSLVILYPMHYALGRSYYDGAVDTLAVFLTEVMGKAQMEMEIPFCQKQAKVT